MGLAGAVVVSGVMLGVVLGVQWMLGLLEGHDGILGKAKVLMVVLEFHCLCQLQCCWVHCHWIQGLGM